MTCPCNAGIQLPASTMTCPPTQPYIQPCPVVQPCPAPCQTPCVTCPVVKPGMSVCAALGAGPAPGLAGLCGAAFDQGYILQGYQLNTEIAALATVGIGQSTDKNLRDLSGKIRYEVTKQNEKLADWYLASGCCGKIQVNYDKVNNVVGAVTPFSGCEFDVQYAQAMIGLLSQARDAGAMASTTATIGGLRDQGDIVVRSTNNEIFALQRWLCEKGSKCGVCPPAGIGAGPYQAPCVTTPCVCPTPCPTAAPVCPAPCPTAAPVCPTAAPVCPTAAPVCPGTTPCEVPVNMPQPCTSAY